MFTHSSYSFKYGTTDPEEIVLWGTHAGFERIVLADINNTSGVLNFVRYSIENKRVPIVGVDFRNGITPCYLILAQNNIGFEAINSILTSYLHTKKAFPAQAPHCKHCLIIYPWGKEPATLRENEFIGISPEQLNRFRLQAPPNDEKCIAFTQMTFRSKQDFNTHRLLRAIDLNCLLSKLPKEEQAREDECFHSRAAYEEQYRQFPELIQRTDALLQQCGIRFDFGENATPQNIASYRHSKEEDLQLVKTLCEQALLRRYTKKTTEITDRIAKEINIIYQKNYLSYFLVAWDIVSYAQLQGYFYVGRGSGANSIVAYLLGITDVDPLELDLYFERFINLYRENPPDFDIDFSWKDRDDVIRYIFKRFPNSALICTYSTFQYKATIRELGKVFGLPKPDIDMLCDDKSPPFQPDQMQELVLKYSKHISGLPSHLSVHAGGIVISEKPIAWFTSTFLTSKGFPTTQFSMIEAEDVGLYKFDILSQRGLGKIRDTLDIIRHNQPENPPHDIREVNRFKTDKRINRLLREATAIGCFYVESPAMRMLMIKLRTNSYLELVAASSIIRPGVASSGMMREYILRHRNPERIQEAHPTLLEIMPDTYGVMVYQEDVIKVAHHFAGLNLAESDVLRRGMSGKFRSRDEFMRVQQRFFDNCKLKGYDPKEVSEIWRQIESFAGYAFSKGHSASYAVESYQSLYLKTYYPLEYMVATINNFGGFYRTEIYILEARKLGATIEAPCIHQGQYNTTISGTTIYLGFQHINGIEEKHIQNILKERTVRGPFSDFSDLLRRVYIPLEQLLLLIRADCLRSFPVSKKKLLWYAHLYHNAQPQQTVQAQLFMQEQVSFSLPSLTETTRETAFEQMELFDFPLCNPFDLIDEPLAPQHLLAGDLEHSVHREIICYGYLVTVKRTLSPNNHSVHFGTLLDQNGDQLDTVHFPQAAQQYPYRGRGIYEIRGKVACEFDYYTIEVTTIRKIPYCDDPRYTD